jgi:hypothetical protein
MRSIIAKNWQSTFSLVTTNNITLQEGQVSPVKSFFGESEVEYFGYKIKSQGIQPVATKIQAIQNLKPPTK